ncbi:hypothetical protein [Floridanema evergladense]|uniref:Phage antirepressor protein n=1 Tax=Floridaenema evergladense BLCC-F167 TaxID=3153639 RepID=A0ABV4WCW4_9CYAN
MLFVELKVSNLQVFDTQKLVDGWLQQEQAGEQFPVPFDIAWQIAGYSRKDSAKRKLPKRLQGEVFHISVENSNAEGGRPKEIIKLSCDGLKHLALMAETEQGDAIRQYFIECEKKWRLVQQCKPEVASEIEILKMKIELAKQEAIAAKANEKTLQLRHYVATNLPEPVQQKILGYEKVQVVEYRDRVLIGDEVVNDGDTITKSALCYRYGFVTRNGKPDYKKLNAHLDAIKIPSEAWKLTPKILENQELRRDYLEELDKQLMTNDRQMWIGE